MGIYFNQPLNITLSQLTNLTHLTLDYCFNQELEIPFNIHVLILGCNNKHLIENLPDSIVELHLLENFNLELSNLPSSIKTISFHKNSSYNKELNNLPKSLEKLYLPQKYNIEIKTIYPKCQIIK